MNARNELENNKFQLCKDSYVFKEFEFRKRIVRGIELSLKLTETSDTQNLFPSNDSKTFLKKVVGWRGIRGSSIPAIAGIYKFSIQIDKCDANCHFMMGWL